MNTLLDPYLGSTAQPCVRQDDVVSGHTAHRISASIYNLTILKASSSPGTHLVAMATSSSSFNC